MAAESSSTDLPTPAGLLTSPPDGIGQDAALLLAAVPDPFYVLDRDGRIVFINDPALQFWGLTRAQVIGRKPLDVRPELRTSPFGGLLESALVSGQPREFDQLSPANGRHVWVRVNPLADGRVAVFWRDSTELHRAEQALRASNDQLRSLNERLEHEVELRARQLAASHARMRAFFALSTDWLSLFRRDATGEFRYVDLNRACAEAYGMAREDVIGQRVRDILGEAQAALPLHHLHEAVRTGQPQRYQARRTMAGRTRVIDVVFVPTEEQDQSEKLILSTARDLTEREELESQLRQALKMEAVGHLTGGVAHDFNNLLTAVLSSLELIQRRSAEPDVRRLAATAEAAARRGAELTSQLLAFSRRQMLRPEIVDLRKLLDESALLLRRVVGETHELRFHVPGEIWLTRIDPTQFQTAMMNLIINARDAMPAGGTIEVSAGNVSAEGLEDKGFVEVRVRDSGAGMSPDVIARAFEPFFTTKPVGKGSGLGLSMVQGFVSQSGGSVEIDSASGQGTTIRLLLPRADAPPGPQTAKNEDLIAIAPTARILFVEDDETVREAAVGLMQALGHQVEVARNGPEAMAKLRAGVAAEVLLSDVVMPGGMDGGALARAARQLRPDIRIVLTSGYAAQMGTPMGEEFAFLPKPFHAASLQAALRRVLARST